MTTVTAPATTANSRPNLAAVHVQLQSIVAGLDSPVAIAWRKGDAHIYVAEQPGRVRAVDARGTLLRAPVLSLPVSHGNEQGLLGIAFSPDGRYLYVDYTDPAGDSHVDEYVMNGTVAEVSTRRQVLFQQQPYPNHNGGEVAFGPDGLLYIGFGDGGSQGDPHGNGQNLGTLLGKILRISPRPVGGAPYTAPSDNPFVGQRGARPEVWMYGLRNPWRFTWDRATGDMWIGDVGQNKYEEIDVARAGEKGINWGWSAREGFHAFKGARPAGARDPILETTHDDGNCAIVGGYVYRGSAIPALDGVYLYSDNCKSDVVAVVTRDGRVTAQRTIAHVDSLTSFGEDPQGEIYALARGGTVYRFAAG